MLRYGRKFNITQELMGTIATYMNDDIREDLHFKLAPCKPDLFLRDPNFEKFLYDEFGIEMEV